MDVEETLLKCGASNTIDFCTKALAKAQATFGENHPDTADCYSDIGQASGPGIQVGKREFDKANTFYKQALQIQQATLGENHPSTAITINRLQGLVQLETGNYAAALSLFNKALAIAVAVNHPELASFMGNLSAAQLGMADYDNTIKTCMAALAHISWSRSNDSRCRTTNPSNSGGWCNTLRQPRSRLH